MRNNDGAAMATGESKCRGMKPAGVLSMAKTKRKTVNLVEIAVNGETTAASVARRLSKSRSGVVAGRGV